jgi:hypothetical protein
MFWGILAIGNMQEMILYPIENRIVTDVCKRMRGVAEIINLDIGKNCVRVLL